MVISCIMCLVSAIILIYENIVTIYYYLDIDPHWTESLLTSQCDKILHTCSWLGINVGGFSVIVSKR